LRDDLTQGRDARCSTSYGNEVWYYSQEATYSVTPCTVLSTYTFSSYSIDQSSTLDCLQSRKKLPASEKTLLVICGKYGNSSAMRYGVRAGSMTGELALLPGLLPGLLVDCLGAGLRESRRSTSSGCSFRDLDSALCILPFQRLASESHGTTLRPLLREQLTISSSLRSQATSLWDT
jgi:hypothetical protein